MSSSTIGKGGSHGWLARRLPSPKVRTRFFEVNIPSGVRLSRVYLPGIADKGWWRVVFNLLGIGAEHSGRALSH